MRTPTCLFLVIMILMPLTALAQFNLTLEDPSGDDKGPGTYIYPTAPEYKPGSFDLKKVTIVEKGDKIEISVSMKTKITDPWNSKKSWTPPGQGFSLQFIQIYIDMDHQAGSGHKKGLPGLNVNFKEDSRWEKVILVSPQAVSVLRSEVEAKAKGMKKDIIIPKRVKVRGKKLVISIPKADLGVPSMSWGWQVVVQSNEGYPSGTDLLTRKVNEIEGEHRFGGGNDWDCDPHVLDIIVGPAKGGSDEAKGQTKALGHKCAGSDLSKAVFAELPMVYPGK
jgi:carbohydrate-binding DOMON domain-containing protein